MFTSPGEVAFFIGNVPVYYYGLTMALALCFGVFVVYKIIQKFYPELDPEIVYDISPYIILSAIIGARFYYCFLAFPYYQKHFLEIFQVWQGGLSIHGAILGGFLGGFLYVKKHKLQLLKLCDIYSYGLVLGQAVGRWGNFFNSEAFGRPTDCFLKLYVPIYERPIKYLQENFFHPTFLYESVLDVCIFMVLFFIIRKIYKRPDGVIFFSYLILYSIVRIFIEQLRIDSVLNIFGVPIAQWVSIFIIIISSVALFVICSKRRRRVYKKAAKKFLGSFKFK